MVLVVEDGSGVDGANSYVSVADAVAYATARGLTFPASPVEPAEAALIRACAWLDATYGTRYSGARVKGRAQPLGWPRVYAFDAAGEEIAEDEIPGEIVSAQIEAAIRELAEPGSLSPDLERGGAIKSLKAGSVAIEYAGNAPATTTFATIDGILRGLLVAAPASFIASSVRG